MFFGENPFDFLGVHARDGSEAVDKAVRATSPEREMEARRAASFLKQEGTRTEAEFYWPVDLAREDVFPLVDRVMAGETLPADTLTHMVPLSRALFLMNELYYGKGVSADSFLKLEKAYSGLSLSSIVQNIRAAREAAGYPVVPDDAMLEGWMQGLVGEIGRAAQKASGRMPPAAYANVLVRLGQEGQRSMMYVQLLSDYEEQHREDIHQQEGEAAYAAALAATHPAEALELVKDILPGLIAEIRPLYVREGCWVLAPLFHSLRNAMVGMYKKEGKEAVLPWHTFLSHSFGFVPEISAQLAEDQQRMEEGKPLELLQGETIAPRFPKKIKRIPSVPHKEVGGMVTRIIAAVGIVAALAACWMLLK